MLLNYKIKFKPEDFFVREILDLDEKRKEIESKRENKYDYFLLTKKNYSTIFAIKKIAKYLHTSNKLINFAGTKDKNALTQQYISIYNLRNKNLEKDIKFFNLKNDWLKLGYLGKFSSRLNLGDNKGNFFRIIIRDLEKENFDLIKKNFERIKNEGVLNYYDKQRFGFSNNNHIVGKYILKDDIEKALYLILTSKPENEVSENLNNFVNFIKENWDRITNGDKNVISELDNILPENKNLFFKENLKVINYLVNHKNDYYGAFRLFNKKLRLLFINAYQSFIFNSCLDFYKNNNLELPKELGLINENTKYDLDKLNKFVNDILKKDAIKREYFLLKRMPELKLLPAKRETKIYPKNFRIINFDNDEFFENKYKLIVEFELKSGAYGSKIVESLFLVN